jgi:Zn-dependent oligopeptidase
MKIPLPIVNTPDGHYRTLKDLQQALLNRLTFTDNIQSTQVTVTFGAAANVDTTINHNLGRIPVSFQVFCDRAAHIYKGTVAWTATTITLKSDTANAVATILIV